MKPLVEGGLQRRIVTNASSRARRHIGIAWLGALTLGMASALVFPGVLKPVAGPAEGVVGPLAPGDAGKPAAPAGVPQTPAPAAMAAPPPVVTEAETEKHRAEISRKLSRTAGIGRGMWISRSTLSVDREIAEKDAWPLVCGHLQGYPDLVLTRVQMNPPQGSTDPVRWRQCEAL